MVFRMFDDDSYSHGREQDEEDYQHDVVVLRHKNLWCGEVVRLSPRYSDRNDALMVFHANGGGYNLLSPKFFQSRKWEEMHFSTLRQALRFACSIARQHGFIVVYWDYKGISEVVKAEQRQQEIADAFAWEDDCMFIHGEVFPK